MCTQGSRSSAFADHRVFATTTVRAPARRTSPRSCSKPRSPEHRIMVLVEPSAARAFSQLRMASLMAMSTAWSSMGNIRTLKPAASSAGCRPFPPKSTSHVRVLPNASNAQSSPRARAAAASASATACRFAWRGLRLSTSQNTAACDVRAASGRLKTAVVAERVHLFERPLYNVFGCIPAAPAARARYSSSGQEVESAPLHWEVNASQIKSRLDERT